MNPAIREKRKLKTIAPNGNLSLKNLRLELDLNEKSNDEVKTSAMKRYQEDLTLKNFQSLINGVTMKTKSSYYYNGMFSSGGTKYQRSLVKKLTLNLNKPTDYISEEKHSGFTRRKQHTFTENKKPINFKNPYFDNIDTDNFPIKKDKLSSLNSPSKRKVLNPASRKISDDSFKLRFSVDLNKDSMTIKELELDSIDNNDVPTTQTEKKLIFNSKNLFQNKVQFPEIGLNPLNNLPNNINKKSRNLSNINEFISSDQKHNGRNIIFESSKNSNSSLPIKPTADNNIKISKFRNSLNNKTRVQIKFRSSTKVQFVLDKYNKRINETLRRGSNKSKSNSVTYRSNKSNKSNKNKTNNKPRKYKNNVVLQDLILRYHDRTKYPFIFNSNPLSQSKYTGFPKFMEENYKQNMNLLINENKKMFNFPFSIVKKEKFSNKFQDPLNDKIPKEEEGFHKKDRKLIKNIIMGKNLLRRIDREVLSKFASKKTNEFKQMSRQEKLARLRKIIIKAAVHFKTLSVSYDEFKDKYIVPKYPLKYRETEELILSIRNYQLEKANDILDHSKYIVLDYDNFKNTPLHWAAMRNAFSIIPKIIGYGGAVDAKNFLGETPLHIAVKKNNYEAVIFLCLYLASPSVTDNEGKKPKDYCQSFKMDVLCKRIQALHVIHLFGKPGKFYENVQRGFSYFVVNEYKYDLNKEAYYYVYDKAEQFKKDMYAY